MRCYEMREKEFWIWRGVSVREQYTKDIHVDETGWLEMSAMVVEALKICSVFDSLTGTVMKSSVQYETKHQSNTAKPDASVITALVLSSYEGDLTEMGEMMEAVVLEESLRQKAKRDAQESAAGYTLPNFSASTTQSKLQRDDELIRVCPYVRANNLYASMVPMSFYTAPFMAPPELLHRTSDSLEGVNEALLLGETEELLNCLEPAAFALSSSSALPQPVKVLSNDAPSSGCKTVEAPATMRRRGRRCWKVDAIRNPSRERLQIELATLRQQASDLEAELTLARAHSEELEHNKLLLIPTWERIAKRQYRARTASEDENTRLKRMVACQRVFVTQLQHTWHQWQQMTRLNPYSAITHANVRFEAHDPALFDMLAAELDLEYMRLDQVFRDAGHLRRKLDVSSASVLKSRQLSSGQVVPFVEVRAVEAEPYDYSMLTQVSWQCMHDPTAQRDRIHYDDVSSPERTRAMKMRAITVHDGRQVVLEMLVVSRRYVENDRTTFVWRGLFRADDGARELFDTFTEETGWITMQSMASLDELPIDDNSASGGTLTLTCVHIEPKRQHALQIRDHGGSVVQDPLMTIVEQQFRTGFQRMNEMIEDRIMDAVVG